MGVRNQLFPRSSLMNLPGVLPLMQVMILTQYGVLTRLKQRYVTFLFTKKAKSCHNDVQYGLKNWNAHGLVFIYPIYNQDDYNLDLSGGKRMI